MTTENGGPTMPGFLEMLALLIFTTTVTGLLLAGVISTALAADRRAAERRVRRHTVDPAAGRAHAASPGCGTASGAEGTGLRR